MDGSVFVEPQAALDEESRGSIECIVAELLALVKRNALECTTLPRLATSIEVVQVLSHLSPRFRALAKQTLGTPSLSWKSATLHCLPGHTAFQNGAFNDAGHQATRRTP